MRTVRNNIIRTLLIALAILVGCSMQVCAFVPYEGYEYNSYEESSSAPIGYVPHRIFSGGEWGVGELKAPQDMVVTDTAVYLLDSGNGRVLVLDKNWSSAQVLNSFTYQGEQMDITGAKGLFITTDGRLLIADTEHFRILETDATGVVSRVLTKPVTPLISEEREFRVTKVLEDPYGRIYALVNGINEGAVTFREDGTFDGFFASNEVERTAEVLFQYIWRKFMTEEQIRNSKSFVPAEFTNFDLDERGFLYTVTQSSERGSGLRLLNFKGSNLQSTENSYGDLEWDRKVRDSRSTTFVDVDADEEDYIFLLDSSRGRVFNYSRDGMLLTVFGSLGNQLGTFKSPVAVETDSRGYVYVLDNLRNTLTVFQPTEDILMVREALRNYEAGQYTAAKSTWEKVLSFNSNSEIAYYGIGLALDEAGEYAAALPYFKQGNNHKAYSDAFREVRKDYIKSNFLWLTGGALLLLVAVVLLVRYAKHRLSRQSAYVRSPLEGRYTAPLFTALHPLDGFENLRQTGNWSVPLTVGMLITMFLLLSATWFWTGFSFNENRASDFNVLITLTQAFGVVVVWVVANWAVCTLSFMEGKGRMKDIWCMTVYALLPFILSLAVALICSNCLTLEEESFLILIRQAGIWWSAALLLCGLCRIHQYNFAKTLLSVVLTLLGMAIIVFLVVMFFGLMQQLISFVKSIISEIRLI